MAAKHIPMPARIRQRDTFFKARHIDTGLYIELRCGTRLAPRLTDVKRCTHFLSYDQAVKCLTPLGPVAIEIERHDA